MEWKSTVVFLDLLKYFVKFERHLGNRTSDRRSESHGYECHRAGSTVPISTLWAAMVHWTVRIWKGRTVELVELFKHHKKIGHPIKDNDREGIYESDGGHRSSHADYRSIVIWSPNLRLLDPHDFGCPDHRIRPLDRLPRGRLVIEGAIMAIRVPVLRAEERTAPAPESRQSDLPLTSGAPIYGLRSRRWRWSRLWSRRRRHRNGFLFLPPLSSDLARSGSLEAETRGAAEKTALAHILGGRISWTTTAVAAHRQFLRDLKLLFLPLRHLPRKLAGRLFLDWNFSPSRSWIWDEFVFLLGGHGSPLKSEGVVVNRPCPRRNAYGLILRFRGRYFSFAPYQTFICRAPILTPDGPLNLEARFCHVARSLPLTRRNPSIRGENICEDNLVNIGSPWTFIWQLQTRRSIGRRIWLTDIFLSSLEIYEALRMLS